MSAQVEPEIANPSEDPVALGLVKTGIAAVIRGRITLADLFASAANLPEAQTPDKKPPVPVPLTDEQKAALRRLPEIYGKVVVTADRRLTKQELCDLVVERETIAEILGPLEKRKSESIREVLANHLDHLVPEDKQESARKDKNGHYAVKQNVSVEGTGKKVQRTVAGGKPVLTIEAVERLLSEGQIDRATYLAITRKPDHPRVLDEDGLHRAIQKDPRLFFLLGSVAEPTVPVTTITVANDRR